jgi:hypothetical protein
MAWTTNETRLNYNQYTPCKAIFQGVCDEIGEYYAQKGITVSQNALIHFQKALHCAYISRIMWSMPKKVCQYLE